MMRKALLLGLLALGPVAAVAKAPDASILPVLRPGGETVSVALLPGLKSSPVPVPRPGGSDEGASDAVAEAPAQTAPTPETPATETLATDTTTTETPDKSAEEIAAAALSVLMTPEQKVLPVSPAPSETAEAPSAELEVAAVAPVAKAEPTPEVEVARAENTASTEVLVAAPAPPISKWAVGSSLFPNARPKNFSKIVKASTRTATYRTTGTYGKICGDSKIRGKNVSSIPGKLRGCGVSNPVKVYEVDGIKLSSPATVNCTTAKALKRWVNGSVKPAVGRTGGGVASLHVMAGYSCRTRNNRPGAKISEHGKGNAIDIGGIKLRDGTMLSVLKGWRTKAHGRILKRVHKGACGTFGTVLGPNADRYHQDHFHFDVARHRGGAYCR